MEQHPGDDPVGINRRTLLKRSAVVGGALVWAAPAVQTLAKPAFAAGGSAACNSTTCSNVFNKKGVLLGHLSCGPTPEDRDCPCECFGQPGSVCAAPNPCLIVISCVPGPGPCPSA